MNTMVQTEEIIQVLRQFNPWWSSEPIADLPDWQRPAFRDILEWLESQELNRSLLLTGPRQVGKTTLYRQAIQHLLRNNVPPQNIFYATFDHPLLKLAGQDRVLQIWREYVPPQNTDNYLEYIFLDEFQYLPDWTTWLKHQTDFNKNRRIAVTGSSASLLDQGTESGVGRWLTIRLPTLSFYEYLRLRNEDPIDFSSSKVVSLQNVKDMSENERHIFAEHTRKLTPFFHQYLIRGGFPECAKIEGIPMVQRLLREDIIDKILKRDMTALFGVRQVLQLEQLFLYLCLHDGSIFDFPAVCESLGVKRATVERYLSYFEATHLLTRLRPFGYGKEVLRGRSKFYLADPAIATAVFLRGTQPLEDLTRLGIIVESTVFKHLTVETFRSGRLHFSYWRGKNDHEVDIVAELGEQQVPFEIKYRSPDHTFKKDFRGLIDFCKDHKTKRAYIITKSPDDIGTITVGGTDAIKIPAPLACYLLGRFEHSFVS
ncbi:ATPase [Planctomycetales bacterium]|nr:ATPase [Planctomycetales bacterium]